MATLLIWRLKGYNSNVRNVSLTLDKENSLNLEEKTQMLNYDSENSNKSCRVIALHTPVGKITADLIFKVAESLNKTV